MTDRHRPAHTAATNGRHAAPQNRDATAETPSVDVDYVGRHRADDSPTGNTDGGDAT